MSRVLLGFLVAYVLAFQGMAGAFASARHAGPLPAGVLCSGATAPGETGPTGALHDCGCDAFCGAAHGASLPPQPSVHASTPFFLSLAHGAARIEAVATQRAGLQQQPRGPPFAI